MGAAKSKKRGDHAKGKQEKKESDVIDSQIWKDKERDAEIIKLLLLGAGESGKSTLFKQMIKLYGDGFTQKDYMLYIPMIHNNTIAAMKELCFQSLRLGEKNYECLVKDENNHSRDFMDEAKAEERLTPEIAAHIKKLWRDPGILNTYELRAQFQLVDSANYFFDDIERISQPNFIPNDSDLIHCRVRTTGIVENKFVIDDNKFLMVDVGGQRNERKKWIRSFEGVTAVIFVAAISAYDQVLYEDGKTNRMDEALNLFAETCRSQWFVKTSFILFLNKRDLFADKIKKVSLTVCFKDYPENLNPNDYNDAVSFIENKFVQRYDTGKKLYVHVTCATDSNNVAAVFSAVKDIIIQKHLTESGLI